MSRPISSSAPSNPLRRTFQRSKDLLVAVGLFSGIINLLALTGSFYMLQVYDRVLPSNSVPTLIGLTVLMALLYVANGFLDFIRVRVMSRVGVRIDNDVRASVYQAIRFLPLKYRKSGDGLQPIRDLDTVRGFCSGLGPTALFDLPWVPIYLLIVFLLHPVLGVFAVFGAIILVSLTLLTEQQTREPTLSAVTSASARYAFGEETRRNAEVIHALGLGDRMLDRWEKLTARHVTDQMIANDAASGIGSISKVMRLFLQSGILGLGAWLVIQGEVSAGTIVAASIIMARALAPIETAIAHWRGFVAARQSYDRLSKMFEMLNIGGEEADLVNLPKPRRTLMVKNLAVAAPGERNPIIHGVNFTLNAGDGLGIIGPSASGKSTLARALTGIWQPLMPSGSVRLDGAALDQWSPEALGRHIGYLPQEIALFDGTIAENISRFDPEATSEATIKAAEAAGVHEMIVNLPQGYQTRITEGGAGLSVGQRQRIGLARALYGDPFLVVLDEPNSNLDTAGDNALTAAIRSVRARGGIAIVIAHRPSALAAVDTVLAMARGQVAAFGPKADVLKDVLNVPQQPQPAMPAVAQPVPAHSGVPRPAAPATAGVAPAPAAASAPAPAPAPAAASAAAAEPPRHVLRASRVIGTARPTASLRPVVTVNPTPPSPARSLDGTLAPFPAAPAKSISDRDPGGVQ